MSQLSDNEVVKIRTLINRGRSDWDIYWETGESVRRIRSVRHGAYRRVIGNVGR